MCLKVEFQQRIALLALITLLSDVNIQSRLSYTTVKDLWISILLELELAMVVHLSLSTIRGLPFPRTV